MLWWKSKNDEDSILIFKPPNSAWSDKRIVDDFIYEHHHSDFKNYALQSVFFVKIRLGRFGTHGRYFLSLEPVGISPELVPGNLKADTPLHITLYEVPRQLDMGRLQDDLRGVFELRFERQWSKNRVKTAYVIDACCEIGRLCARLMTRYGMFPHDQWHCSL